MEKEEIERLQKEFRENGFIFLPGFLTEAELHEINQHLDELIRDKVPDMGPETAFYEIQGQPETLKQIQRLFDHNKYFHSLMFGSKFDELARILLEDEVVGKNMQYFNKAPRIGRPTPAHQDGYYFMLDPNVALTMWLGLDDVDEENGCVRYVRGSHLKGMRPHSRTNVLGFSQGMSDFGTADDLENEVWFKTRPGDLLVHHSLTIHRADGNSSATRTRKALGFIYYASRAKEDTVAKQEYQFKLAEELRQKAEQAGS